MSATVQVVDVAMPGMFDTRADDEGGHYWDDEAYEPLPYALGAVCEVCWLRPRPEWWRIPASLGTLEWSDFDHAHLRAVGRDGCPHGGAS